MVLIRKEVEVPVTASVFGSYEDITWGNVCGSGIFNLDIADQKTTSPERVLFIAVFLQALLDATKPGYENEPRLSKLNRDCAIKWFSMPQSVTASSFEPICELAGINPSYARQFFEKILDGRKEFTYRRINMLLNSSKN